MGKCRRATPFLAIIELREQAQDEAAGKHCRTAKRDPIKMGADAERAAADIIGLQAYQRQSEKDSDQCCENGVLEEWDPDDRRLI